MLVDDPSFIDTSRQAWLRENEFKAIKGNEYEIQKGFERYIKEYRKAKKSGHPRYETLLKYSTLQYFESAL